MGESALNQRLAPLHAPRFGETLEIESAYHHGRDCNLPIAMFAQHIFFRA